jgi:hypothetical protein
MVFFCSGYQKNIFDFRNKSNEEFLEITKNREAYCGIYLENQIRNPSIIFPSLKNKFAIFCIPNIGQKRSLDFNFEIKNHPFIYSIFIH